MSNRAENSNTHRHLCEFTGLDFEMEIKEHYFEVLDILDKLFVHMFDGLNDRFGEYLVTRVLVFVFPACRPLSPLSFRCFGSLQASSSRSSGSSTPSSPFSTCARPCG